MANSPPVIPGILLILVLFIPFALSCHNANGNAFGYITGDSSIKAGSNFQISCTLNSLESIIKGRKEIFNSSNIRFEFNGKKYPNISDSSSKDKPVHLINETTATMDIHNASINDSGFYYCYLYRGGNLSFVCSMYLEVGLAPREIGEEHFRCVSLHHESLNCSWDPPHYNTQTNYSLDLVLSENPPVAQNCPERYSETACAWTGSSDPPYRQYIKTQKLILTSSNIWGELSETFLINSNEIIIAPEVVHIKVEEVRSKSVFLNWSAPEQMDIAKSDYVLSLPFLTYEIHVYRLGPVGTNISTSLTSEPGHSDTGHVHLITRTNDTSFNFTNLTPYHVYIFKIRTIVFDVLMAKKDTSQFWSQFTSINTTTQPDVPAAPPQFNMVYESIRTDHERRNIVLYWNPLNETDTFGPGFHYLITYEPINTATQETSLESDDNSHDINVKSNDLPVKSSTSNFTGKHFTSNSHIIEIKIDQISRSSYTFDLISSSSAYLFKMYSVNQLGISSNFSQITIDKQISLPPRPVSVEAFYYVSNKYEIRWSHPSEIDTNVDIPTAYIVSSCVSSKPAIERCTGPLKTIEVATNITRETAATLTVEHDFNHHFAVAAKFSDGKYSPLSWASCLVPIGIKKLDKLPKVYAKVINDTAIRVTWTVTCQALSAVITKFELTYCKWLQDKSSCIIGSKESISIANSTARDYIVDHLQPSTLYRFQLTAWTENTAGDESDLFFESTQNTSISIVFIILITLIIILLTVIIITIIKCLYSVYKILFSVYKTNIDLPKNFQSNSYDCDGNVSSTTSSSYRFPARHLTTCGEISDHSSAQTLNSTIDGHNISNDHLHTSMTGLLVMNSSHSNIRYQDICLSRKSKRLPDGVEESSLNNIDTPTGNNGLHDTDVDNCIFHPNYHQINQHHRALNRSPEGQKNSFDFSSDLESGYTTSPCLSKESSVESGKSKSNIAATSLTKKEYVPFIPQYLDSTVS